MKCARYSDDCDCSACEDDRYQAIKAHEGFCRLCNAKRGAGGCTNGLCAECHQSVCTDGGATYPGHYIDATRQAARLAQLQDAAAL